MSSSSRAALAIYDQDTPDEHVRRLARMLAGIAHECSLIGNEVARAGGVLSDIVAAAAGDAGTRELQGFDALAQNAHAQAKLIVHLTRVMLQGTGGSITELLRQIDDVPLPAVRRRMQGAIGAPRVPAVAQVDDDTTFWLDGAAPDKAGG
jgi:hypothetical protein